MIRYLFRRLGYGVLVIFGVVILVFTLFNILPADPARLTLGQRSDVASLQAVRHELYLDKPLPVQFLLYVNDLSPIGIIDKSYPDQMKHPHVSLFQINNQKTLVLKFPYLRRSYQSKKEVWSILMEALPNTIALGIAAMIFASIVGILLGVLAAVKQNTWMDTSAVFSSVIGISAPSFFSGIVIAYIFGFLLSNYTGLHMTGSMFTIDPFAGKVLSLKNMILPALTLGIRPLAIIVQLTRSSMLDVMSQDYIRTAYAKGLSKNVVLFKHALKNAMNPVVTAITGWLADLITGSFFVEYIFGWKGIGKVTVDALEKFDFPVVMGSVLVIASIFVFVNIFADFLYALFDPRIELK